MNTKRKSKTYGEVLLLDTRNKSDIDINQKEQGKSNSNNNVKEDVEMVEDPS